jgi:hypothetical protein
VPRLIGFDLFEQAPAHEEAPLDGPPVTWEEAQKFGYELYKGDTNETLKILNNIPLTPPIAVFIDGGHSYETTMRDIAQAVKYIKHGTFLLDDISMPGVHRALADSGLPWRVVGIETARVDL